MLLRLVWAALCFAASILCVAEAPTYHLWLAALGATEWGHWAAPLCLLALLPGWRASPVGRVGAVLAVAAATVFLSPAVRAWSVSRGVPEGLARAFGEAPLLPGGRSRPLSLPDLWLGVRVGARAPKTVVFASPGGKELRMDVFSPSSGAPAPVLLSVHGGSWAGGERGEFAAMNAYFADRGYVVASPEYRLAPGATFPAAVEDVRSAVAYVKAHAKELGADPGRIVLLGRSAGGQLALCAAYEHADPSVRGVAAFYAPNDLVYAYSRPSNPRIMDSRAVISAYMGGPPDKAAALYTRASPLEMVGPKTPPTFLLHGLRDELVWKVHSERLEERLRSAGRPGYFLRLPWATHGCDYNLSGPCGQLTLYAMERFLSAVTR